MLKWLENYSHLRTFLLCILPLNSQSGEFAKLTWVCWVSLLVLSQRNFYYSINFQTSQSLEQFFSSRAPPTHTHIIISKWQLIRQIQSFLKEAVIAVLLKSNSVPVTRSWLTDCDSLNENHQGDKFLKMARIGSTDILTNVFKAYLCSSNS